MEDVVYLEKYKKQLRENTATDKAIIAARNERIRYRISQGKSDTEALVMELELLDMLGYHYQYGTQRKPKIKNIAYSKKVKKYMEFFAGTGDLPIHESEVINNADKITHTASVMDASIVRGFAITGFILNGIYLMSMPFIYLLAKVRGEPVPFDTSDKVKWGISISMLALGIVAFAVPPVGFITSLTLISISAAMSIYGLITYAYQRNKLNTTKIIPNQQRIDELATQIKTNIDLMRDIQYQIKQELKLTKPDNAKLLDLESKMQTLSVVNENKNESLLKELELRRTLRIDRSPEKTLFTTLSAGVKVAMLGVVIAGIVLAANPFTAPVGAILITTFAAVMIAHFVASKIHMGRMAQIKKATKAEIDAEHQKVLGLDTISSSLITAIKFNPKPAKEKSSPMNSDHHLTGNQSPITITERTSDSTLTSPDVNYTKPKR
jgi:hypothetical protein